MERLFYIVFRRFIAKCWKYLGGRSRISIGWLIEPTRIAGLPMEEGEIECYLINAIDKVRLFDLLNLGIN